MRTNPVIKGKACAAVEAGLQRFRCSRLKLKSILVAYCAMYRTNADARSVQFRIFIMLIIRYVNNFSQVKVEIVARLFYV
jgi:hypothetical protein